MTARTTTHSLVPGTLLEVRNRYAIIDGKEHQVYMWTAPWVSPTAYSTSSIITLEKSDYVCMVLACIHTPGVRVRNVKLPFSYWAYLVYNTAHSVPAFGWLGIVKD